MIDSPAANDYFYFESSDDLGRNDGLDLVVFEGLPHVAFEEFLGGVAVFVVGDDELLFAHLHLYAYFAPEHLEEVDAARQGLSPARLSQLVQADCHEHDTLGFTDFALKRRHLVPIFILLLTLQDSQQTRIGRSIETLSERMQQMRQRRQDFVPYARSLEPSLLLDLIGHNVRILAHKIGDLLVAIPGIPAVQHRVDVYS